MKSWQKMLCVGAVTVLAVAVKAETAGSVTLPETGVDIGSYGTAGITYLGGFIAACVGGTLALIGIKAGVGWVRGMMFSGSGR